MRRFFCFFRLCLQNAAGGCWTRAVALGGLLGAGIFWIVLLLLSSWMQERHMIEAPTTYWGVAGFTFVSAVASLLLAFLLIYSFQFITAPARLYWAVKDKNDVLEDRLRPKFTLSFDDECLDYVSKEGGPRKKRGWESAECPAWYVLLRLTSESDATIDGCTAHFVKAEFKERASDTYQRIAYSRSEPLSLGGFGPFELRPRLVEHINVYAVDEIDQRIRMQWKQELQVYERLFDRTGLYKLTIRVTSTNGGCDQRDLEVDWRGTFEKPRVRLL